MSASMKRLTAEEDPIPFVPMADTEAAMQIEKEVSP